MFDSKNYHQSSSYVSPLMPDRLGLNRCFRKPMDNLQLFTLSNLSDGNNNDTRGNFNKNNNTQFDALRQWQTLTSDAIIRTMNQSQLDILWPSLTLISILLLLGIPGNLISVIVYSMKMKRSTAGYFIITLAISDLINCLVSLPVEMVLIMNFWSFDIPMLCKLSRFITAAMNNTSSFILVAIAIERHRSICFPLKPRMSHMCAKITCAVIVVCAVCSAIPMVIGYGTFTIKITTNNISAHAKTCLIEDSVINTKFPLALLVYFFVGHLSVFITLAILYILIARKLLRGIAFMNDKITSRNCLLQTPTESNSETSFVNHGGRSCRMHIVYQTNKPISAISQKILRPTESQSAIGSRVSRRHGGQAYRTKRLTCMLFLVTSVFEISFIPYLVVVSIRSNNPSYYDSLTLFGKMTFQFFLRFYMINCAINPIIYCFYNQNFRHGVKKMFVGLKFKFCSW
ncbi:cholecystokinin receptor-like [Dreissena polymorpha]|uniref:G-protein coupled receptors family 1 profile domain-containing protein n=1 Tax=Dreissena polymorpha TaxID=45954 RepID=A0A9D4DHB0_DREPO|nr:cholecystokinin receptor-like [Dreissena polymorpha]KAH3748923.1 hypothetical protein DPMN_183412 [Dreissena polymorpha]